MVDIIDYLDDFMMQLDAGISPENIKSIAHQWCNYDLLYIYCGYGRSDASYVIHQKTKIIDNPETEAHKRKKQMQLKRAEKNCSSYDFNRIFCFQICFCYGLAYNMASQKTFIFKICSKLCNCLQLCIEQDISEDICL